MSQSKSSKNKINLKALGIYGAGGLGREVYELASLINLTSENWSHIVFIDDGENIFNPRELPIFKFSELKKSYNSESIEICIAIGEPEIRRTLYDKILLNNYNITSLIHPKIHVPKSTKIGLGAIISNYVSLSCDVKIGNNVYIHPNACIGHDSKIDNSSVISSYVDVAGDCNVGESSFLAINVCLKHGTSIGSYSIVGMGSIVFKDLPSNIIAIGNPARVMKKNELRRVFK